MTRDLRRELFDSTAPPVADTTTPAPTSPTPKEITLSELANLSELAEEQAKVRVKVTHLSARTEAVADALTTVERHFDKVRDLLRTSVTKLERLSDTDDLQAQQLGNISDSLRNVESQLEAQRNALAFLRNSDGQQQQTIERLKQSRITLTHILLFGILLCAGSAIALDIDKALQFHQRLNDIEYRLFN